MTTPPALLFDLDGTLIDSVPDLAALMGPVIGCDGPRGPSGRATAAMACSGS